MGRIGMVDLCFVRCIFMSCFIFKGKRIIFLFFFAPLSLEEGEFYGGLVMQVLLVFGFKD